MSWFKKIQERQSTPDESRELKKGEIKEILTSSIAATLPDFEIDSYKNGTYYFTRTRTLGRLRLSETLNIIFSLKDKMFSCSASSVLNKIYLYSSSYNNGFLNGHADLLVIKSGSGTSAIEPKYWNFKTQCVKSTCKDHQSINDYLSDFKRGLTDLYRDNWRLSFQEFKNLVFKEKTRKTLASALRGWLRDCRKKKDEKTYMVYLTLWRHLRAFRDLHKKEIRFDTLDWGFYDSFRSYLYDDKEMVDSSVEKNVDRLKAVLKWAEGRDYPVNPVYKKWPKSARMAEEEEPVTLTIEELEMLEATTNLTKEEAIGRDYLCLEARIGSRISDIKQFDIRNYQDCRWTFYRKKGSNIKLKQVTVHFVGFCAPALRILERHNFCLPQVDEQTINGWIKLACERVGLTYEIDVPVWIHGKRLVTRERKCDVMSTHTGRRTFVTLALQFMPPKIVKDLAGIDSYRTLKRYEAKSQASILQSHLTSMDQKLRAIS